jgi:hypothetical protein
VYRVACAACLASLALAGCGAAASSSTQTAPRLRHALAQRWEDQANAIAAAAAAGNACRAQQLASSLRDDVIAHAHRIPRKLSGPLLAGVNALADRITCIPPTDTVTTVATVPPGPHPHPKPKPKPKPKPPDHGPGAGGDKGKP